MKCFIHPRRDALGTHIVNTFSDIRAGVCKECIDKLGGIDWDKRIKTVLEK